MQTDRRRPLPAHRRRLLAGGPGGNEQLTAATGVVLIALLAALGVTILRIGQLLDAHMFIGMLLIGPVALKLASTGYRFVRYYAASPRYRAKGPPPALMRALAPVVVLATLAVFATGVALLFAGPSSRGFLSSLHKLSFILWLAVTARACARAPRRAAARRFATSERSALGRARLGRGARALALAGSLVGGLVLALVVEYQFAAWAGFHHH